MADEPTAGTEDLMEDDDALLDGSEGGGGLKQFLALCAAVVVIAAGAGYGVGMLFSGRAAPTGPRQARADSGPGLPAEDDEDLRYYELEPLTVNLDEPEMTRYLRISLRLGIAQEHFQIAETRINEKLPELRNWLNLYFASCTRDDVRGQAHLNRLRREILDAVNNQLWPDAEPVVRQVLIWDIAVS